MAVFSAIAARKARKQQLAAKDDLNAALADRQQILEVFICFFLSLLSSRILTRKVAEVAY